MNSILHKSISGTMIVSGLYGAGKTVFAMTAEHPELVTMIDLDQKSKARAEQLGMAYFTPDFEVDPVEIDMDALLEWFRRTLDDLPDDRTTLIIDNASMLEDAFHVAVAKDPQRYNVKPGNVASGKFGGTNPGVGRIWKNLTTYLQGKGYKLVIICVHMSAIWAGGAPIDKYKAKGNKTLTELANLTIVLTRSKEPNKPPRGIVGKEALGLITFEEGEFKVSMALPPVIPECTWKDIGELIDTAGERTTFTKAQKPTKDELQRYGQWLTKEQMELIRTIASNPDFGMSEEEATGIIAKTNTKPTSWEDVTKLAVANKGYDGIADVRTAAKAFYRDGMSFEEVYDQLPNK